MVRSVHGVSPVPLDAVGVTGGVASFLLLAAVVSVVLALATDDREPSIVLAWLFVILLLPLVGVVAYFFVGRNHRRETRRRVETQRVMTAAMGRALRPVLLAQEEFDTSAAEQVRATPAQRVELVGRRRAVSDSCRPTA